MYVISPGANTKNITRKKSFRELKYSTRKYSLNEKGHSKGKKRNKNDLTHIENKK